MSKSKGGGGSSAPAAPAQPDPAQTLANMMSVSGGGGMGMADQEMRRQMNPQDEMARLFPALAQLQEFRSGFRDDMSKQALGGLLKMFGGGGG